MAYILIHAAIAVGLAMSVQRALGRGFILDEDGDEVRVGTVSFGVAMVFQTGLAAYCVFAAVQAALCI